MMFEIVLCLSSFQFVFLDIYIIHIKFLHREDISIEFRRTRFQHKRKTKEYDTKI